MHECLRFSCHFSVQYRKVKMHECYAPMLKSTWGGGELGKLGKTQNCILGGGDHWWPIFMRYHLVSHLGCNPFTRNHKNGNYNLWSQHRDLQPKPNPTKFGSIFNFNMMSAILDAAITRNHKNDNYNLWSEHRDLQSKLNPTKFGLIFNFHIMSVILDFGHYQKSQK